MFAHFEHMALGDESSSNMSRQAPQVQSVGKNPTELCTVTACLSFFALTIAPEGIGDVICVAMLLFVL